MDTPSIKLILPMIGGDKGRQPLNQNCEVPKFCDQCGMKRSAKSKCSMFCLVGQKLGFYFSGDTKSKILEAAGITHVKVEYMQGYGIDANKVVQLVVDEFSLFRENSKTAAIITYLKLSRSIRLLTFRYRNLRRILEVIAKCVSDEYDLTILHDYYSCIVGFKRVLTPSNNLVQVLIDKVGKSYEGFHRLRLIHDIETNPGPVVSTLASWTGADKVASEFTARFDFATQQMCMLNHNISELKEAINTKGEELGRLASEVSNKGININPFSEIVEWVKANFTIPLGLMAYVMISTLTDRGVIGNWCMLALTAISGMIIMHSNVKNISSYFLQAQSLDTWASKVTTLVLVVLSGSEEIGKFSATRRFSVIESIKRIREASRLTDAVNDVVDWFKEVVCLVADVFGYKIDASWRANNSEVVKIQLRVLDLLNKYVQNPSCVDRTFTAEVSKIQLEVTNLLSNTILSKESSHIRQVLMDTQNKLVQLHRYVNETGHSLRDRNEMAFLPVSGAPGCGKTYFSTFVSAHLSVMLSNEEELMETVNNYKNKVYVWPIEAKHFDLYKGEPIIMFPDLFALTDVAGKASEATYLIYLVGGQAMELPAAELTKKQKLWLISDVTIACTNVTCVPDSMFASIRDASALRRRLNQCGYYQYVNPKYAVRDVDGKIVVDKSVKRINGYENDNKLYARLDESKVDAEDLPDDVWFFRKLDFATGCFADNIIYSQNEYLQIAYNEVKKQSEKSAKKDSRVKTLVEKSLKLRTTAQTSISGMVDDKFELKMNKYKKKNIRENKKKQKIEEMKEFNLTEKLKEYKEKMGEETEESSSDSEYFSSEDEGYHTADNSSDNKESSIEPNVVVAPIEQEVADFDTIVDNIQSKYKRDLEFLNSCAHSQVGEGSKCISEVWVDEEPKGFLYDYVTRCTDYFADRFNEIDAETYRKLRKHTDACSKDDIRVSLLSFDLFSDEWIYSASDKELRNTFFCYNLRSESYKFKDFKNSEVIRAGELIASGRFINRTVEDVIFDCQIRKRREMNLLRSIYVGLKSFTDTMNSYVANPLMCFLKSETGVMVLDAFKKISVVSAAIVGVVTVYRLVRDEGKSEIPSVKTLDAAKAVDPPTLGVESQVSRGADYEFISKRLENFRLIYVIYGENGNRYSKHLGTAICLGGRTFITPDHVWKTAVYYMDNRSATLILSKYSDMEPETSPFSYTKDELVESISEELAVRDIACITINPSLDSKFDRFPNILSSIPPRKVMEDLIVKENLGGIYTRRNVVKHTPIGTPTYCEVLANYTSPISYSADIDDPDREYHESIRHYSYPHFSLKGRNSFFSTVSGECGSAVFLVDNRKNRYVKEGYLQAQQPWLVYMHTFASTITPKGTILFRELFSEMELDGPLPKVDRVVETINKKIEYISQVGVCEPKNILVESICEDVHNQYAFAKLDIEIPIQGKTFIKRSEVYKHYSLPEPERYPVRMRNFFDKDTGDEISPIKLALKDYGRNNVKCDDSFLANVSNLVINDIFQRSQPVERADLLNYEICLYGDPAYNLKPFKWDTSAGFTFRYAMIKDDVATKGKEFMIDRVGSEVVVKKWVFEYLSAIESYYKEDLSRMVNISIANLKDETLPAEKVKQGKCRIFFSNEFDIIVFEKKYFGALNAWCVRNHVRNGFLDGVNPYSQDWDDLGFALSTKSKFLFDDFSKFDKYQRCYISELFKQFCRRFYSKAPESEHEFREKLLDIYCENIVLVQDKFCLMSHCNVSGRFLTLLLNSFANKVYHYGSFVRAWQLSNSLSINASLPEQYIRQKVVDAVLGDDVIFGFDDGSFPFDFFICKKIMKEVFGMTITDDTKGREGERPYKRLDQGEIAGRRLIYKSYLGKGKWYSPLRSRSKYDKLHWSKGNTDKDIELAKFDETLIEEVQEGEAHFNFMAPRLLEAAKDGYGSYPKFCTFPAAQAALYSLQKGEVINGVRLGDY